jgi:archaellum component FlaC
MEDSVRLDKIESKVDNMDDKLQKIYESLVGSEFNPDGIVKTISEMQEEIKALSLFKSRVLWTVALLMSLGGIIGFVSGIIFNYITGKT